MIPGMTMYKLSVYGLHLFIINQSCNPLQVESTAMNDFLDILSCNDVWSGANMMQ